MGVCKVFGSVSSHNLLGGTSVRRKNFFYKHNEKTPKQINPTGLKRKHSERKVTFYFSIPKTVHTREGKSPVRLGGEIHRNTQAKHPASVNGIVVVILLPGRLRRNRCGHQQRLKVVR